MQQHIAIFIYQIMQAALVGDFFWCLGDVDAHSFIMVDWCAQIEIFDVDAHEVSFLCQDAAVEEAFKRDEVGCIGA